MSKLTNHPLPRREDYNSDREFERAQDAYYEDEKEVVRSQEQNLHWLSLL